MHTGRSCSHFQYLYFMKTVLLTTEYFGPVSSYKLMHGAELALIEHCENYQKKSYRNRCRISSPNDIVLLTVPLASGKNSKCPIAEVTISYEVDWIEAHHQSLLACYGKSPYYEYYIDDLLEILHRNYEKLIDLNTALTAYIVKYLDIETGVAPTAEYQKSVNNQTIDLRRYDYLNRSKLDIEAVSYEQVWSDRHDFRSDLSILDLLFCKGPEGILFLD